MPKAKRIFGAKDIDAVSAYLKAGGVLAYPTESVWGLGCDASHPHALDQIISLKNRDLGKGLIVLSDTACRLQPLLDVSHETFDWEKLEQAAMAYTASHQRALTWLVPVKAGHLPKILTGDHDTLAVRITTHPLLSELCRHLISHQNPYGFLVSTSCNRSGQPPARTLAEAMAYFGDRVAYLDAQTLGFDQPSCIQDLTTGQILR